MLEQGAKLCMRSNKSKHFFNNFRCFESILWLIIYIVRASINQLATSD